MLSPEQINTLKSVSIPDFLASRGLLPVSQEGSQLLYHSPLRNDQTASSFWVHPVKNTFIDFVIAEHKGDVIRLVQLLDACDFLTAVQTLQRWSNQTNNSSFFLSGQNRSNSIAAKEKDQVKTVKLLANKSLIRYVESRGISYPIARKYLREVYYSHKEKSLFALGFENDKGSFALRNGVGVKRNIGPAYYTTIPGKRNDVVSVFEGFFDFLSALEYFGLTAPNCTTIVFNSTTNLEAALPALKGFSRVNTYFDHDKSGRETVGKLISLSIPLIDRSNLYQGYKDLNEYWTSNKLILE